MRLERLPDEEASFVITGAEGGALAFLLASASATTDRPFVVITTDEKRARELAALFQTLSPCPDEEIVTLRPLDTLPYSGMSPSRNQLMDRATSLFRIVTHRDLRLILIPAMALMDRLPPRRAMSEWHHHLKTGDTLSPEPFARRLIEGGYHRASVVSDPGTFARRGGLIDVFCPLHDLPLRIDLWGDEIDTMRFFDPETQRTQRKAQAVDLGPAHPIIMTDANLERAQKCLLDLADACDIPTSRSQAIAETLAQRRLGVGMEEFLPAFYDGLEDILDYVPTQSVFILDQMETWHDRLVGRFETLKASQERLVAQQRDPVFPVEDLYTAPNDFMERLSATDHVISRRIEQAEDRPAQRFATRSHESLIYRIKEAAQHGDAANHRPLLEALDAWREDGYRVVLFARQEGGLERLRLILQDAHEELTHPSATSLLELLPGLYLALGDIGEGFVSEQHRLVLLNEQETFGRNSRPKRRRYATPEGDAFSDWRDMQEGDYIVHLFHGIGRYLGLNRKRIDGIETDFLVLEYAGTNRLFIPVDRLHLVSRYRASEENAPRLDSLGGQRWQRAHSKVRSKTRDIADALLKVHARRKLQPGFAYSAPDAMFHAFEAAFPFEETEDQATAIEDVMRDMGQGTPMDRLLCGDVGFGKTEVALRAAFRAIMDGKQVAVVVPTRVLAQQHHLTFTKRFAPWAIEVATLTGSDSRAESLAHLEGLTKGRVDVVIGTHRLLSKDVVFRDLGLLVLDEEHRFGVTHKEKLKSLKADIDVLTLTATPLPRTLHTSLLGLRDLSLIRTPPLDRLAVRTLVARPTDEVIQRTLRDELARNGQVFYVHNRVQDIDTHAELLGRLVPEASIAVAHGQMRKGEMERVMLAFVRGDTNVLVCTTVIESGIDIPRANTIIINRAHELGLAQLYQLRGRVGRSSERATCLLLVQSEAGLTEQATQRVATIQRFVEPGSGFAIASYDMEIRGVGDLLGAEQSGSIHAVGLDAYLDLLSEAVEELRGEAESARPRLDPELKIALETRIPHEWIPDNVLRLRLYRSLARSRSAEEVGAVFESAVDRFGKAPDAARRLVELMQLKSMAAQLGFSAITYTPQTLALTLTEHGLLTPELIPALLTRPHNGFRLSPGLQLIRPVGAHEWQGELDGLRETLREIWNFVSNERPTGHASPSMEN